MYVRISSADGRTALRIRGISRTLPVRDLKPLLVDTFAIPVSQQGLLFMGKELLDELTLHNYGVKENDLIHVFDTGVDTDARSSVLVGVNADQSTETTAKVKKEEEEEDEEEEVEDRRAMFRRCSFSLSLYRVGDVVDVRDMRIGAWREARVADVRRRRRLVVELQPPPSSSSGSDEEWEPVKRPRSSLDSSSAESSRRSSLARREEQLLELSWDDDYDYSVRLEKKKDDEDEERMETTGRHLRPRAQRKIRPSRLNIGDQVLVNYNPEVPDARGVWLDAVITGKRQVLNRPVITATVFTGPLLTPLKDCRLLFPDEIYALEVPGMQVNAMRDGEKIVRRRDETRSGESALGFGHISEAPVGVVWPGRTELTASSVHRPPVDVVDVESGHGVLSLVLRSTSGLLGPAEVIDRGGEVEVAARGRFSRLSLLEHNLRHARPVRVVRSGGRYGPRHGLRYDGLYVVDRCWSVTERHRSSPVLHFLLRRDDDAPEPWTSGAVKKRSRRRSTKENERPEMVTRRKRRRESGIEAAAPRPKRRAVSRKK